MNGVTRIHGGKSRIKNWLFKNFPPSSSYMEFVDICGGGGSVSLNIKPSIIQSWNDLDPKLYSLMYAIKYDLSQLQYIISNIECTKENFLLWKEKYNSYSFNYDITDVRKAAAVYVTKKMSRGGMGKDFSESTRFRGGRLEHINAWENGKLELDKISARLQNICLFNLSAKEFYITYILNDPIEHDIFIYADFPYVQSTRSSPEIYDLEMSDNDHTEMAELFNSSKAKIAVSGYESKLYEELYPTSRWRVVKKEVANNSGQNKIKQKRIECLWLNY